MIKTNGKGFLNDWDLAKRITKGVEEPPPGTMSVPSVL